MRKTPLLFAYLLLIIVMVPLCLADGVMHSFDKDMNLWQVSHEERQLCAINYKDGYQHMILLVELLRDERAEKAVWIFPVPAQPEETRIDILKYFPQLYGSDIQDSARNHISNAFMLMYASQIYPIPLYFFNMNFMPLPDRTLVLGYGVNVHEHIEKMGLVTELVSTANAQALAQYMNTKKLSLPESSMAVLDEYAGKDYSFVVSYVSNPSEFFRYFSRNDYVRGQQIGRLGVYIKFPTDKIFFPLRPTSIYGEKVVPAIIYVMDFVEPELYEGIADKSTINYYSAYRVSAPEELEDFFSGYEQIPSENKKQYGQEIDFYIRNPTYTRIELSAPSSSFTDDLWMTVSMPKEVKRALFFLNNQWMLFFGLIIYVLCSCLASLFSAMIVFRKKQPSKKKFALFGLFNILTIAGLALSAYTTKIYKRFTRAEDLQKPKISIKKFLLIMAIIVVGIVLLYLIFVFLHFSPEKPDEYNIVTLLFILYSIISFSATLYIIITGIAGLILWGYYLNKRILMYLLVFSAIFMTLVTISKSLILLFF